MQRLLNIMAFDKVIPLDAATSFELSEACWEVITKSNNFFREGKGYIVGIKEIDAKAKINSGIYGVVKGERNFAIGYSMSNRDGSSCGTTVYWTTLAGGILCHGTNSFIKFNLPIDIIPTATMLFTFDCLDGSRTSARVLFGGTEPTLEEKTPLLQLIAERKSLKFDIVLDYMNTYDSSNIHYILHGARNRYTLASKFLRLLLKGKYNSKTNEPKKVRKIEYVGKCGETPSDKYYRQVDIIGVYKVFYADGSKEYKKAIVEDVERLLS